jgi:regulator of sigma E protease
MIQSLFSSIYVALVVILFFGVTIFVHELGHYLVARWCGLVVKVFSIGFGHPIWKREVDGVVYKIGWIPFGGYVSLPQLDPTAMEAVQGSEGTDGRDEGQEPEEPLPPVAAWKKILVSVAGATCNVLLAIVIAWVVYLVGMPATTINQEAVMGYVSTNSPAYAAGLRIGDRIVSVNGTPVSDWGEFVQEAATYDKVELEVTALDAGKRTVSIPTEEWQYGVRMVGGIDACGEVAVGAVSPGMSAEKGGVQPDDVIKSFAGETILSRAHLIGLVAANRDKAVAIEVEREVNGTATLQSLTVTPEFDVAAEMTRIGIEFRRDQEQVGSSAKIHPPPMKQIEHHASMIFRVLKNLVTPRKSARTARMVGGPILIIVSYVGMIKASLMLAVWFTGLLNINLAIINLLPIPVLDGGHIIFSLWEMIMRKPLKARVVNALVNVFAVLIIGLFAFLSLRDVWRHTPAGRLVNDLFLREAETNLVEAVE